MKYNFQTITLNITEGCNLRCKYCQVHKDGKTMSYETLSKALNWIQNNVEHPFVSFFGGEPLLEYEKIKWAIENYPNIRFGLSTNLTLLSPERIKFFFDNNIKMLFSIDGIGDTHDQTRDNSWNSFKHLLPILGELYSDAVFRITITPDNVSHLCETIVIGHQIGFKNFNALPDGMSDNWTAENYAELKKQLTMLHNDPILSKYFRPFSDYAQRLHHPEKIFYECCDAKTAIAILPNGDFSLCGEQTENDIFIVGNIDTGIDQAKVNYFWQQVQPCPIHCKANPICSKERCFSRRYFTFQDLNHRISNHCKWYNIMEEVINGH